MLWIKICGITNMKDAEIAEKFGADALGFIFTPSSRRVAPETAREIINNLDDKTEKIGVFVNEEIGTVEEIVSYCGLDGIQFHGRELPEYLNYFNGYTVTKTIRVNEDRGWDETEQYLGGAAHRLLLDTYVPGIPGGTGRTFDWELVKNHDFGDMPVIIAGGITPENVLEAVKAAEPFGIDVGSGVEESPGKKDEEKLIRLFKNIRSGGL